MIVEGAIAEGLEATLAVKLITPEQKPSLPRGVFVLAGLAAGLGTLALRGPDLVSAYMLAFALATGVVLDLGTFLDSLTGNRFEVDTRQRTLRHVREHRTVTLLGSAPGVELSVGIASFGDEEDPFQIWTLSDGRQEERFVAPPRESDRDKLLRLFSKLDAVVTEESVENSTGEATSTSAGTDPEDTSDRLPAA